METNLNLVLVDDHTLFRDGLKYVLNQVDYINVVGEASNGREYLELLDKTVPDITLMDIAMPGMNGVEATREAIKKNPNLKIIALTMFDDEKYYYDILHAGAKGFVLKDSDSEVLLSAILSIAKGENYFSNEVLLKVIRSYTNFAEPVDKGAVKKSELTAREVQILKMICNGQTNKEIAETLSLNQRTVEGIRGSLLNKTKTTNSLNLVLYAIENKLIEEE